MHEKIAKIRSTHLGYEDHGIFTAWLDVDYGGSGQGVGMYCLDEPIHDDEGKFVGRVGTKGGMDFIIGIVKACGVETWEKVAGRTILVLTESDDWNAKVVGIKPLPTERGETLIFADVFSEAVDANA